MKHKLKKALAAMLAVLLITGVVPVMADTAFTASFKEASENSFTVEFSEAVADGSLLSASTVSVKSLETGETVTVSDVSMTDSKTAVVTVEDPAENIGGEYLVLLPDGLTGVSGAVLEKTEVLCQRVWVMATAYTQDFNKTVEYIDYVDARVETTDWYQTSQILDDSAGTWTVYGFDGKTAVGKQYFDYLQGGTPVLSDNTLVIETKARNGLGSGLTDNFQKTSIVDYVTDVAYTEDIIIEFDAAYSFNYTPAAGETVDQTKGWFRLLDTTNGQHIFSIQGTKVGGGDTASTVVWSEDGIITQGEMAHYKIVIDGVNDQNGAKSIKDIYIGEELVFENIAHQPWAGTGGFRFGLFIDYTLNATNIEQKLVLDNLKVTMPHASTPAIQSVRFSQDGENAVTAAEEISPMTNRIDINFANEIDGESLNGIALRDSMGNVVTEEPSLSTDGKTVTMKVAVGYLDADMSYNVYIPKTVKSINGIMLSREYRGAVTVKDARICVVKSFEINKNGDETSIDLSIINTEGRTGTWWLSYAVYDGNTMTDVFFIPVTLAEGIVNKSLTVSGYTEGNTVKAFLWNDFANMKVIKDSVMMQ